MRLVAPCRSLVPVVTILINVPTPEAAPNHPHNTGLPPPHPRSLTSAPGGTLPLSGSRITFLKKNVARLSMADAHALLIWTSRLLRPCSSHPAAAKAAAYVSAGCDRRSSKAGARAPLTCKTSMVDTMWEHKHKHHDQRPPPEVSYDRA